MSKIYLYAEILANIRQISLYASLQTDKLEETTIDVSSDKRIVTVSAGDDRASIFLPTGIGGDASLNIPTERKKELSVRLEIGDLGGLPAADELRCLNDYPWTAKDLHPETHLRCKSCEGDLVKPETITAWKDLPSEGWAEMMDLWHCHKPQDEHVSSDAADTAEKKGYSSASRVTVAPKTGLVDIYSFLFDPQDCNSVQPETSIPDETPFIGLLCTGCNAILGFQDHSANGFRLYKSSVSLKPSGTSAWESFPATTFICAQLLAVIESQATRKFVLHSGANSDTDAHLSKLWVFNPDLLYCSSQKRPATHRGMKIFYQHISDPQKILDRQSDTFEELFLSPLISQEFITALKESTGLLPMSARNFKEWSVGLLDRYQRDAGVTEDVDKEFQPLFTSGETSFIKAKESFDAEFAPLYE